MKDSCPPISKALIKYLDDTFPDKAVNPADADAAVFYGSVKVVRHLKAVHHMQQETHYVPT